MNKKLSQRLILGFGAAAVFLMLIFPPFQIRYGSEVTNCGYAFIFEPACGGRGSVNGFLLLVQWTGVVIFCLLAFFMFGTANPAAPDQEQGGAKPAQSRAARNIRKATTKFRGDRFDRFYLYIASLSTIFAIGATTGVVAEVADNDYSDLPLTAIAAVFSVWIVYWFCKRSNFRSNTSAPGQKNKAGTLTPGDELQIYMQLHREFEDFKKSHAERPDAAPVGGLDKASSVGGMVRNRLKAGDKTFEDVANSIHVRDPSVSPDNIVKAWNRVRKADVSRNLPEAGDARKAILDRYKASLEEQIAELQSQLHSGVGNPKETQALKVQYDELNKDYHQIFARKELTENQRFEQLTMRRSIEKRIMDKLPW